MGFDLDEVARSIDDRRDEWLDILGDLLRVPSENPPGDTTEVAEYFAGLLEDDGVDYEVVAPREEMPNVVAGFDGGEGDPDAGPHLSLNGHFDTFPAGERDRWEHDPFSGEVVDGEVWGRGATDMHAGFVASFAAFRYLYEHRGEFQGRVTFAATSDEESGGRWGAEYLLDNYPEYRGDALINGEPTSPDLVSFGTRGMLWLDVEVRGVSGISAYPTGVNAIEEVYGLVEDLNANHDDLVHVDGVLREVIDGSRETIDANFGAGATDHVLDLRTNVGTITGGEKVNLYAERARAEVDVRLPITTDGAEVLERIRSLAADRDAEFDISVMTRTDPTYTHPDDPIVRAFVEEAASVRGSPPDLYPGMAGTDTRFYRHHGVEGASYGVTSINVGRQNERAPVDEFVDVTKVHARVAAAYLDGLGRPE